MSLRLPSYNVPFNDDSSSMSFMDMYKIFVYIFSTIVVLTILVIAYNNIQFNQIKDQIIIPNLINWIKSNSQKKAKESPFISYKEVPLPDCPILDSTEKGQNIVVKYRIPRQEKDNIQETNITIMVNDN